MRRLAFVLAVLGASGCKVVFGSGDILLWNSTDQPVDVTVDGRTSGTFTLPPHRGEHLEGSVAGAYKVTEKLPTPKTTEFALKDGGTVVVNVGSAACFARSDISGMYTTGREPVRLLQLYDKLDLLVFDVSIPILPGEPPPARRPKSAYAFQRLSEVPCNLMRDEAAMADWVRKTR